MLPCICFISLQMHRKTVPKFSDSAQEPCLKISLINNFHLFQNSMQLVVHFCHFHIDSQEFVDMPMQKYFSTVQKKFSVTFEISDSRCKGASQRDLRFKGSKGSPKLSRAAKTLACINLRDMHLEQKSYFFNEIYALQEEHKCVFHDHILCPTRSTLKDANVVLFLC